MKETIPSHWYHDKLMRDVDDADWLKQDDTEDLDCDTEDTLKQEVLCS